MTNKEKIEKIRKEMHDLQMDIASDIERFGNKAEAQKCRDEAWQGILRPGYWNDRIDVLFNWDVNDI